MRAQRSISGSLLAIAGLLLLQSACAGDGGFGTPRPDMAKDAAASVGTQAVTVQSIAIVPTSVTGGSNATATIQLSAAAPAGGLAVGVSSNNVAVASVSPNVTVPAGATTASFTVSSHPVASTDFAGISATAGGVTRTVVLTVEPSGVAIASLAINPTLVASGATATGTVTLSGTAPSGGASVTLSSDNAQLATVPSTITVAAGATTATFDVTAGTPQVAAAVTITALYGGVSAFARIVVDAAPPTGASITLLTITPDIVVGSTPAQGMVTIGSALGVDTPVALTSSDVTVATVPSSVIVPAGATTATFVVTTLVVPNTGEAEFAVITGASGGTTRSASITTTPLPTGPFITTLKFFPGAVGGGGAVTGRIILNGLATQGGQVTLVSSQPGVVQVPATVVVLANTSRVDFPITTAHVSSNTTVTITATGCCGAQGSVTGTLTVTTNPPPPADVVAITSAVFKPGGRGGTLTVKATSTSPTAILTVFRNQSTVPTFVLTNNGGGKYDGSFSCSCAKPQTVTVTSNRGGTATANVK